MSVGVYIPGMELPKSCFTCPFRRKVDPDNIMCIVTREVFEETFAGTIETRSRGNCPLIPVPDHGRLIDADALMANAEYKGKYDILSAYDVVPVLHGRWVKTIGENGVTSACRCNLCGFEDNRYSLFNYCPNCGAKMGGDNG